MSRIAPLLDEARARLATAPFRPPRREALLLLARVLGLSEAQVLARGDEPVAAPAAERYRALLERRLRGEPVAYLLGEREFYGRPFSVDRRVLIPRPETEHLVEAALALELPTAPRVLDVGTGSGVIAVTLALERPDARLTAVDLIPAALAVARGNARRHGVERRVRWVAADLATALAVADFDLVVSNPPYIGRHETAEISPEILDFEPAAALFSEPRPTTAAERLLTGLAGGRGGADGIRHGVPVLMEIGKGQVERLREVAPSLGFELEAVSPDYAGIPRVARFGRA